MMFQVKNLGAAYAQSQVLNDLSVSLDQGEVLCLLGRNGAGKTTALKAIVGLVRRTGGSIHLQGEDISELPVYKIAARGIAYVPQGRRLFGELSVAENIEIGLRVKGSGRRVREQVLDLFPVLKERLNQAAGTLSGGEQQMLATARALCTEPGVLLLDEPTEGLMPSMVRLIRDVIIHLKQQGVAVLLVEQRLEAVYPVADRVAFLENGNHRTTVGINELRQDDSLVRKYLGIR